MQKDNIYSPETILVQTPRTNQSPEKSNGTGSDMTSDRPLPTNAPLVDRLERVIESVHLSGFDGIESVVSKYYTSDLSSSSRLASAQRLSRKRKLPGLLSDLYASSSTWTERESQRYKDEILRSAEDSLVEECRTTMKSPQLQALLGCSNEGKQPLSRSHKAHLNSILESEVSL
jgi:hypothetical protein